MKKTKRHPILWALVILLVLGWAGNRMRSRGQSGAEERSLPTAAACSPVSTPRPTVKPTAAPRPTVKPTPAPTPAPTPSPATAPTPEPTPARTGVTPEFKSAMDSYEAFFDEYAAFMKAVSENPGNVALLLQYASMLERYAEAMEELEAIGEEELSAADSAYYIQTTARIEAKLLKVMQDLE